MGPRERQLSKIGKLASKEPSIREMLFRGFYLSGMTAVEAAKQAGYSKVHAEKNAWLLARRCRIAQKPALLAQGLDEIRLAREIKAGLEAKTVKWNRATKSWNGLFRATPARANNAPPLGKTPTVLLIVLQTKNAGLG